MNARAVCGLDWTNRNGSGARLFRGSELSSAWQFCGLQPLKTPNCLIAISALDPSFSYLPLRLCDSALYLSAELDGDKR